MKRLIIVGLLAVLSVRSVHAVTINATKIGPLWTTTPIVETAFQALTQFRGQFTPVNLLVTAANVVLISKIGDGINALRVQMASPLPALQSPTGWTNSETPPTSYTVSTAYQMTGEASSYGTPEAACLAYGQRTYPTVWQTWTWTTYQSGTVWTCLRDGAGTGANITNTTSCKVGYTLSGSTCNLTNSATAQWPSDGVGTVSPVNGVLTPNLRDPDNSGLTTGNISRTGTDTYGNPVSETVSSNVNNGIDYQRDTQSINTLTGEPTVQRDKYSTNSDGRVLYSTSNVYNNSTINNISTQPTTDNSQLAKDATLTQTNTKLDTINQTLSDTLKKDTSAMPALATAESFSSTNDRIKTAFSSHLTPIILSDVQAECPTWTRHIPFLNVDLTIDQFCTMESLIRPTIELVMMFVWLVMSATIILRA